MTKLNLHQKALDHIKNLEYEYGINMDRDEFVKESLPAYFNIVISNENDNYPLIHITYNFEVIEGSAQIVCAYNETEDLIFTLDLNETLRNHVENKWKLYDYTLDV